MSIPNAEAIRTMAESFPDAAIKMLVEALEDMDRRLVAAERILEAQNPRDGIPF